MALWMKTGKTRVVERHDPSIRRRTLIRRLAGFTAVLVGVPVLTLGLTGGSAAASWAGHVTIYAGPSNPIESLAHRASRSWD
jgi:hypothetical protein